MINQSDNSSLDKEIKNNESISTGIPAAGYEFIPIESLFSTEQIDKQISLLDEERLNAITSMGNTISTSNIQTIGNYADPNPSYSSNTFNPVKQQNPPEPSDEQYIVDFINNAEIDESKLPGIVAPQYASMKQTEFLRYYNHPKFNKLGFSPYSNNEENYNANGTVWDMATRSSVQFASLVGSAVKSSYRSYGDLFDSDSYFTGPDKKTAEEFEQAMMIGSSSRGGILGWTNNLMLNSAYTFGTIASIAAEELAIAAVVWATGGTTTGLGAIKTGQNVVRLGTTVGTFFNAARNFSKRLNNVDDAFDFYKTVKAGGNFGADILSPELAATVRNWKTTANTAQNLTNMAKASQSAGAFYRDVRRLNFTLSEAKLEGGFAYNDMIKEGMALKSAENNGKPITVEQMSEIQSRADESAYYTSIINTPLLLATNDLVLGNSLGGFQRSLRRLSKQNVGEIGKRLVKDKATDLYEYTGDGFIGLVKYATKAGIKGNTQKIAGQSLRYFSANFGEGIQEITQEAVSAGTKGYYTGLLEDPLAGGHELFKTSINSAVNEQLSGQGFETFMSGFLMGGLIQGPQKIFFQGLPAVYNKVKNSEAYQEQKQNRQNYIDAVVNSYNEIDKNSESYFDRQNFHFLNQKQIASNLESANLENDVFEYQNEQDRAKFNNLHYLFNDGGQDLFREQLEDYLKLSDEDLANAFPIDKKGQKEGKLKTRITSMIDEIDIMEEKFEKANDLFPDTSNKSIYKKGSREYEIEKLKEESIKHAKMLYMFTDDSFDKAVDRYTKLFEKLEIEPLFKGMDANDITVSTDSANITEEILFLASEIELLKDSESAKDKKLAKQKVKKIEKLNAFKTVITDPENLTKTGQFDKRKKSKLDKVFNDYIRFIADSNDAFIKSDIIENALEDIIDYNSLKDNAKLYSKSLEAFLIPENYNKLLDATYNFNKSKFENREKTFKKQIEEYIGIQERNTLLNQLNSLNVIPDPEEVEAFLLTGDVGKLRTFYDENGEITTNNKEKLKDINEKLEVYNATRPDKVEEEVQEKEVEIENKDLQDVVDSMEVQVQVPRTITPLLSNSLKLAYEEYSSRATLLNKKPLKYNEWLNSKAGKNHKEAFS